MEDVNYCLRCGQAVEWREAFGRRRPVCPACGRVHFFDPKVAVGVLVEHAGQILLIQRGVDPGRGRWSVPAGFVDADEDPRRAAAREAREETGLEVEITGLLEVIARGGSAEGADIFLVYRARVVGGQLQPGDDAIAAGYFGPADLPELAFASTRRVIGLWQTHA